MQAHFIFFVTNLMQIGCQFFNSLISHEKVRINSLKDDVCKISRHCVWSYFEVSWLELNGFKILKIHKILKLILFCKISVVIFRVREQGFSFYKKCAIAVAY